MKPVPPASVDVVKTFISYDPETGSFTRNFKWGSKPAGSPVGSISKFGYRQISVLGRTYTAQRLAWYITYGEWPEEDIDHINRIKTDNRIANLRLLTRSDNLKNRDKWKWVKRKKPVKLSLATSDQMRW